MVAGWDKAILGRVIKYRIGFSEPLLIFVSFPFLPVVTTKVCESVGGGHACITALGACREGLGTPVSCLQAALHYAQPITAPVIYRESWVSICFPAPRECLLHSIKKLPQALLGFSGKICAAVWVTFMPP